MASTFLTDTQHRLLPETPVQSHSQLFLPSIFRNTDPPPQLITQGAEALLYQTHFIDTATPAALKVRPSKPYRHPTLDARLTKQRVLAETRVLVRLSSLNGEGFRVPAVLSLEWDLARKVKQLDHGQHGPRESSTDVGGAWLMMEWIEGKSIKQVLREWDIWAKSATDPEGLEQSAGQLRNLLRRIGKAVGLMHSKGGVIHGDLTSSNIMLAPSTTRTNGAIHDLAHTLTTPVDLDGDLVLIDFGLATQAIQDEDRAVDLYVLERAFGSTHPRQEDWFDAEVLQHQDGYKGSFKGAHLVLKRLEEVRLRGRKRSMIG